MNASGVQRHHWLNCMVGILDSALWLTDVEQFKATAILNRLLVALRVPERGVAHEVPPALCLEVESGFFTVGLAGPRDSDATRPVMPIRQGDPRVSVETWRDALLGMLLVAYPSLSPEERVVAAKVLDDLLLALGVPQRAPSALPDVVIRAYLESPDALSRH